jgi:hypothetical protein
MTVRSHLPMLRRVHSVVFDRPNPDTLVVLLHGCTWTPSHRVAQMRDVVAAVRELMPGADVLTPLSPIEFWSLQDPDDIVNGILTEVDDAWQRRVTAGGRYQRVLMIGFSFGSVLLRQLYCRAAGALDDASIDESRARPWVGVVERMVLLAGLNRGWTVDSPVSRLESFGNNIGTAIGHLLPWKPTLFAIRRGAPFLTRTRLQWVELKRRSRTPPLTIQLLGTRDDLVSPTDNIDLATGSDFLYLEVPRSGHFDVVDMAPGTPERDSRRQRFELALTGTRAELEREAVTDDELSELLPNGADALGGLAPPDPQRPLEEVVFVIHGIRDKGYWTKKIARVIVSTARKRGRQVIAVAPTYGYFALLPFLLPWTRRMKIEWLLDMYVTVRCCYPEARMSYVGHSNGTYLLAGAIESCPAVHIRNVVFAGSVVRSNFDWSGYIARKQVGRVLNYVATADWVVAIFPRFLQLLRIQDLGGAGYDGFARKVGGGTPSVVTDIAFVPGRHGAALDEQHWESIATFVLDGTPRQLSRIVETRSVWVAAGAHLAPLIWLGLVACAAIPAYLLLTALSFPELTGLTWFETWQVMAVRSVPAWLSAVGLFGWVQFVAMILTKL